MVTEERRIQDIERIPARRPVAIFTGSEGRILRGATVNLSPRGMAVQVEGPIAPGDHLVFRMDVGTEFGPVVQGGKVAWTQPADTCTSAGVRFIDLPSRAPTRSLDPVAPPPVETFHPGEELRVKIGGLPQALRAEAVEHDAAGTLRFRCPLALLRLRSAVVVRRLGAAGGPVFEGEIAALDVAAPGEDGIPDLVVTAGQRDKTGRDEVCGAPVEAAGLAADPPRTPPAARAAADPAAVSEPDRPAGTSGALGVLRSRAAAASSAAAARTIAGCRGAAAVAGPAARRALVAVPAALARAWSVSAATVGRWIRGRRRGQLPSTLAEVRERGERRTRRLVNRAAVAMGALGVAFALWGLFGGRDPSEVARRPEPPAETAVFDAPVAVAADPLPDGIPVAWPVAPGPVPPPVEVVPPVAGAVTDHAARFDGDRVQSAAAPPERVARGAAARRVEPPAAAAVAHVRSDGRTIAIPLDGVPAGLHTYALRDPVGIVVDVRGVGVAGDATRLEVGHRQVRLVKVSPRRGGARVIVYLRGNQPPQFRAEAVGNELRIALL